MRIKGLPRKVVLHQLTSFLVAFHDNFAVPLAYQMVLKYGLEGRRLDICFATSLFISGLTFVKYHIKLNYFHGSMLVIQHLRSLLVRKYLSLSERDRFESKLGSNLEQTFSLAFNVRNGCGICAQCHEIPYPHPPAPIPGDNGGDPHPVP